MHVARSQATEEDTRTMTDLLVSQVEFADIIILNKCDLVNDELKLKTIQMIRALNSDAKIIEAVRSKVEINEVIGTNSYDFDKVSTSAAWIKAMNDPHHKHKKLVYTTHRNACEFLTSRVVT